MPRSSWRPGPLPTTQPLIDYVQFAQACQTSASGIGHFDRASFLINGTPRDWTDQTDAALQTLAILRLYAQLGAPAQATANAVIAANLTFLVLVRVRLLGHRPQALARAYYHLDEVLPRRARRQGVVRRLRRAGREQRHHGHQQGGHGGGHHAAPPGQPQRGPRRVTRAQGAMWAAGQGAMWAAAQAAVWAAAQAAVWAAAQAAV